MSDTRKEIEDMRTNPEVMGRTEPLETDGTIWPEMQKFKQRFNDIQSEFIEEPRAAVTKAEQLIEEAVDHIAKSMREEMKRMHGDVESGADTEKLRLIMRKYRAFIESLENRRAA